MKLKTLIIALLILLAGTPAVAADKPAEPRQITGAVNVVTVDDAIGPGVAQFLSDAIEQANEENAACLVIQLDTPGGLAESMRSIVKAILGSRITVVVYVAPGGARAASAGVMITMAADVAAMAPGTNIGAAHPVGAGGKEIDDTMSEKVVNDMVAHAKSVAEQRGRNAEWVEKAIRESVAITETEALEKNVIDLVARDLDDLIEQIDGREIAGKGVLKLDDAQVKRVREDFRTKVLKTISNPNIAYILLMLGLAGLYFELSHPGAIFPGVIGGICLILAFFAMQTLPVNYAGILLILLAIVLFIMEMKITSYGLLSVAGIVAMALGSLMLFKSGIPGMQLSWSVLLPTLALVSGFFILVAGLVVRSHIARPRTGTTGLIDEIGVVKKDLEPEGKVFVHGELWNAVARDRIPAGTRVRVIGVQNLVLEVEALEAPSTP
jgi:membrane-bound serine protease (ClpP class)